MKIKLWDPFPVCPPELAKELFPPLRKGWKRAKKSFISKTYVHFPLPRNQKTWQVADFVGQFGVYLRHRIQASRWERLSTLGTVVLCLFALMKSLYLDSKGSLSVCAEHFSTSPWWLSPSSGFHLVKGCLLASQKELSGHFAVVLCLSWFLWKASLFWICWVLLNSLSVLQNKGLCQERYKGSLWSAGSPFLLARASVMHIFPLLVACTSLLHCLYHSNSGLTPDECCTLWATRHGRTGYIWRESSQIIFLIEGFWPCKQFPGKKKNPTNLWHFPWRALLMNVLSIFAVWWPSGVFGGGYATYKPGNLYFHCQVLIMMSTQPLYRLASQSQGASTPSAAAPGLMESLKHPDSAILKHISVSCGFICHSLALTSHIF